MDHSITSENFLAVRDEIRKLIDEYRINAEKWVVDQFSDIPDHASETAVVSLRVWAGRFLTVQQRMEIFERLDGLADLCRIPLRRETVERLESVRKLYELDNMEETVETLLSCIRRSPGI